MSNNNVVEETKDPAKYRNFYLDKEHSEMLDELQKFYRAPSGVHAVRLILEDMLEIKRKEAEEAGLRG